MDPLEQEILQRFDDSRNAYNKATGLLKSGRNDEAEALLRRALTLYPREIFLNEEIEIDKSVLDSYDLLFSNIRERLQKIEREKDMPPRLDGGAIKSLQDLIERNQGPAAQSRRPGMRTQASGALSSGLPAPPPAHEQAQAPAMNLDAPQYELSHEQIVRELESAARDSHAFKAPSEAAAQALEEGEVDAFEISLDGDETQAPVPSDAQPDDLADFGFDDVSSASAAPDDSMDSALVHEIVLQDEQPGDSGDAPADWDEDARAAMAPDVDAQPAPGHAAPLPDEPDADSEHSAAELEAILGEIEQAENAGPGSDEPAQAPDDVRESAADEPEPAAIELAGDIEPAHAPDEPAPEQELDADEPQGAQQAVAEPRLDEFDDLTPIHKDDNAAPAAPVVHKTKLPENKPVEEAVRGEDVSKMPVAPLPEPPVFAAEAPAQEPGDMQPDQGESALEDADLDIPKPGRGLMGLFDKIKNLLPIKRKKAGDAFDQMLAGVDAPDDSAPEAAPGELAVEPAAVEPDAAPEPVAEEPAPPPEPPRPQASEPGQEQPGEEEALEDESVVAEMVKIEEPRERKVHIQVYDGGRTARLLSNVLVLSLFGVGLLAAYMLVKPSVQLHYAYETAMQAGEAADAGDAPSWAGRITGMAWGIIPVQGESDQRLVSAVELSSRAAPNMPAPQHFRLALAAAGISRLQEAGNAAAVSRFGRWARSNGAAGQALNRIEFQSLSAAASQAMRQGKHKEAKSSVDAMAERLKDPAYPGPGLHDQAVREAARVRFLSLAHAAGAALKAGDAQKAFTLIEPVLNSSTGLDPGLAKAFDGLKQKIKDALTERAASVRQEQGEQAAQPLLDMAARL